jgi:hypothetical protein
LAEYFKISPFVFDDVDYYEFNYKFEALQKEIERKNQASRGEQDIASLFG